MTRAGSGDRAAWAATIGGGAALGAVSAALPGAVPLLLVSIGVLAWWARGERRALLPLSMWALALRWGLILAVTVGVAVAGRPYFLRGDLAPAIFGDDGYYTVKGLWVLKRMLGLPLDPEAFREVTQEFYGEYYGLSGHVHPIAFFYFLFGYSPTAVKGISALLSVLSGFFVFDLAHRIAGRRVAMAACALTWFWPSLVVWSATNLKDPYALFFLCAAVWAFQRWLDRRRVWYLGAVALSLYGYSTVKLSLWVLIVAAMVVTWIVSLRVRTLTWGLGLGLAGALIVGIGWQRDAVDARLRWEMRAIAVRHLGHAAQPGASTYRLLPEKYDHVVRDQRGLKEMSYRDFAGMIGLGVWYFLVMPFPWELGTRLQVVAMPQMLVWYPLFAASLAGMAIACARRQLAALLPFLVLTIVTVVLGVTGGSVGTTFRHRDLIAPFYFIFSAIGLSAWLNWKGRHEPRASH